MNIIGTVVFFGWIPAIFGIFLALPPRRAVIASMIAGWLLVPPVSFNLPGLPPYTKASATTAGILLATLAFDTGRLLGLRPRWYDLPMLAWCIAPIFSSLSNDLGLYDGCSETLSNLVVWGLPYLIGRAYFGNLEGLRELAVGIVIGGLAYAPLCLFELRMSPRIMRDIYGIGAWDGAFRFGAYRPRVFMSTGLELGMWMTATTLVGYWLWASGALRQLRGVSFGWLLSGLAVTTVLCRSSGALLLLALGVMLLYISTRGKGRSLWIWALVALAPIYMGVRAPGLWSGREAVELASSYLGADRAQSLEYRIFNEDVLASRALERPAFGWGGWDRSMTWNYKTNQKTIPDGLWIIALGRNGLFGLTSLTLALLLPLVLLLLRHPIRSWRETDIAPAAALAMLLGLVMVDNLSNAMINLVYTIASGGVITLAPGRVARRSTAGADSSRSALGMADAEGPADPRADLADQHAHEADELAAAGQLEGAWRSCRAALGLRTALASERPGRPGYRRDLALEYERLGRIVADLGRREEARSVQRQALALWARLAEEAPGDPEIRRHWAGAHNDLAWLIADDPDASAGDVARAVHLATRAVELEPGHAGFWNTLGAVRYRVGAWDAAVEALGRAAALDPDAGPNAYDLFFLAMAHARRGEHELSQGCFARAVDWQVRNAPAHAGLARLRAEAEGVLDLHVPSA